MTRHVNGRAPAPLLMLGGFALLYLTLPLASIVLSADWASLDSAWKRPESRDALRLSLITTTVAAGLCILLGVPLAWMLARTSFRGQGLVRAVVTLPLVLPPVVGGIALLLAFGREGLIGDPIEQWTGITFPFSTVGVVMAQVYVALPFTVITVEGVFAASDRAFDEAAATLGASRWQTIRRVTIPMTLPGIAAGAVLSWARALGEFGATITFAGNFTGRHPHDAE